MEPWWTAEQSNFWFSILGATIGVLGAVVGVLLGVFSRRGRFKLVLLVVESALLVVGLISLAAGIAALAGSQPYAVWYPLTLIGLLLSLLSPVMLWVTRIRYANVEARKLVAESLRRS